MPPEVYSPLTLAAKYEKQSKSVRYYYGDWRRKAKKRKLQEKVMKLTQIAVNRMSARGIGVESLIEEVQSSEY